MTAEEPDDDPLRNAWPTGHVRVLISRYGDAVWIQPQRERGLKRDERPLAFSQYLPRDFTRTDQITENSPVALVVRV